MGRRGFALYVPMPGVSLHVVDPCVQFVSLEAESLVVPTGPYPAATERLTHSRLELASHCRNDLAAVRHNPVRMP